jgi:hypothetical protein
MRRAHRSIHRVVWSILACLVLAGLAIALARRPPPDDPATTQATKQEPKL